MRNLKQFSVTFTMNYFQLVKMVCFRTRRMISLCKLFERHKILDEKFQQFKAYSYTIDAEFKDVQSRTQYKKATIVIVYIDTEIPV